MSNYQLPKKYSATWSQAKSARYCTYHTTGDLKLQKTRQNTSVWENMRSMFPYDPD